MTLKRFDNRVTLLFEKSALIAPGVHGEETSGVKLMA